MKKAITIDNVAMQVGVSKTTISRYLNGHFGKMSAETRQRIKEVIEELDYHPNRQAQSLKLDRSYLIGVVVADIGNLYTAYLIQAMFDELIDSDYQLIILNSNNSMQEENRAIRRLLNHNIDALVLQPVTANIDQYQLLKEYSFPVTLLDRSLMESYWPVVLADNIERTTELAHLIIEKGYQRIIHVSEPISDVSPRYERFIAMKNAATEAGIEFEFFEANAKNYVDNILSTIDLSIKTAFFAANGNVLQKLMQGLNRYKIQYPDQCGLCGYDDWNIGEIVHPNLTGIKQDPHTIGSHIIQETLAQIKYGSHKKVIKVKTTLIHGHSL